MLKLFQFINYRVETELGIARPNISSTTCNCHLLKNLLIQFGNHNVALPIFHKVSVRAVWDRLALWGTHSNTEHLYSHLSCHTGCSNGIVLVVLTVGDKDYGLIVLLHLGLAAEALYCCVYSFSQSCSLHRNRLCSNGVEEYLGRDVICSDWKLHKRLARKYNQSNPVSLKFVYKS